MNQRMMMNDEDICLNFGSAYISSNPRATSSSLSIVVDLNDTNRFRKPSACLASYISLRVLAKPISSAIAVGCC